MRRWISSTVLLAAVSAAVATTGVIALASTPPGSASFVAGCTTMHVGSGCSETFQFLDASGNPVAGLAVSFSGRGVKGSTVDPTKGITDANGMVNGGFDAYNVRTGANSATGTEILTAKGGKATASVTITVIP